MAGAAARRPLPVVLAALLVVAVATVLAVRLEPTTSADQLVGSDIDEYAATQDYYERFGDDAIYILVRGPLTQLVLTSDVQRIVGLEGCIGGNVDPAKAAEIYGAGSPCAALAKTKPVKVVYGPGTFINTSVGQIADRFAAESKRAQREGKRAARAARKLALARGMSQAQADQLAKQARDLRNAQFLRDMLQLSLRYQITRVPTLNDTQFVARLVFANAATGEPKDRFAYLFPTKDSALIQVRLKPDLDDAAHDAAIERIRAAVAMPDWKLENGGTYVVTGAPVVLSDLTQSISDSIRLLLLAVVVFMALALAVVFRSRARLVPLLVALAAAALTFGGLSAVGASLTMASIAVLPVLVGLAVDYAIQFQSRIEESRGRVERAAVLGGPTILTAAAATAAGFLVLLLSPVPMVQGFGLLLVIGVVIALFLTLTAGVALVALLPRRTAPEPLSAAWRGAGELLTNNPLARGLARGGRSVGRGALRLATERPRRMLGIALVAAVAGWVLHTQTPVESDLLKLVPQDLPALQDLQALQDATGVGGEIDVVVSSKAGLTRPETVRWMSDYQQRLLSRYGYRAGRGCGEAELCPAFSLPDLFEGGAAKSRTAIEGLLDAVPPYFSQGVITADRTTATMAFGIRLMPLERQQEVIETMRRELDPPEGVTAELAGLPVLAAAANERIASDWRRALQLIAGLLAVGLVLLLALRSWRRALVPLVPIALATGWSGLVLWATQIPLNPMSVTLGALVIAISTEFSVLLSERFRQERANGHEPRVALERTYASTGRAVTASGVTAIAGFAVLVVSDITMLRDFGIVTVVDLTVSLLGVLAVLPAVLISERS